MTDDASPADPTPDEPGYWEQKAAEDARASQPSYGQPAEPTFNPTSAYASGSDPAPGGAPPPPPPSPYGQPGYGQPPYGQPGYGQPYAGGYPQPPHPAYYQALPPAHPRATLGMVLGIVSLVGGVLLCGVGLLAAPFAWVISHKALTEIHASHGQVGGESQARAGQVLGIIGTVLLAIALVLLVLFIGLAVSTGSSSGSFSTTTNS